MKKRRGLVLVALVIAGVAAVILLSVPGSPAYLPELIISEGVYEGRPKRYWLVALDSSDAATKKTAIQAMASIGPTAKEGVPKLARIMTDDPDRELRNEAALALSKMAPSSKEAIPALIRAVEDKEAPVRMNAVVALKNLGADARPAIEVLTRALVDEANLTNLGIHHYNIQEMAAVALGRASAGTTDAVAALADFLKRADTSMQKLAGIRAIAEVGPLARPATEPLLIAMLKDRQKQIREEAAITLQLIGADVPDVGAPPEDKTPTGLDGKKRYPARPGAPIGPDNNDRPRKPDSGRSHVNATGDSGDWTLALPEREYLWQIEHHGNVLSKHGFGPFADALRRADAAALTRIGADRFTATDFVEPTRLMLDAGFASVERVQPSSTPSRTLGKEEFVSRLLKARKLFETEPPHVKLSLMKLAPKTRGQLDGPWQGTAQLRLHGEQAPGAPAEAIFHFRYEIDRPTKESLSRSGWLHSVEILQAHVARAPRPFFVEVARDRGFGVADLHDNWKTDATAPISGGIYVSDFNRDGFLDVLLTDFRGQFLYQGRTGGKMENVTAAMGLPLKRGTPHAAAWVDIDGDGWEDLLFAGRIWRNEGGRRFVDYSERCELRLPPDAGNIIVADYNRDGRLDLYVTRTGPPGAGSWLEETIDDINGNYLFRNNGDWKFEEVTRSARAVAGRRSSFTAAWLDANDDGWPDLYVINEFGNGVLLVNQKDGAFRDHAMADRPTDFGSMGLAVGDVDNDGRIDIYCANMYSKAGTRVMDNLALESFPPAVMEKLRRFVAGSQLHLNQGNLTFRQAGAEFQVAAVGWAYGTCLADLDNDGWLDIYATAGYISRDRDKPDG